MTTPPPPPPPPRPIPPAANAGALTPTTPPSGAPVADDVPLGAAGGASATTLALAAIGAVVVVGVAVIGGLAAFGGSDGAATDQTAVPTSIALRETAVPSTIAPAPTTNVVVTTVAPAPETTAAPETTVAPSTTAAPTTTTAPTTTVAPSPVTTVPAVSVPASTPVNPNVEESKAVVRNGQIYLTGAVPNAAAGIAIEALAAEILGPQNVFNNYVIDPAAGDPNLGNITVEDTITFATSSAVIEKSSETLLNQGLALLTLRPSMTITIVGHTDSRGSDQSNLALSQARAESVKQWFVDRGVDPNRLAALGRGASDPIADNSTPDGQRLNRRIQFFLENILGD